MTFETRQRDRNRIEVDCDGLRVALAVEGLSAAQRLALLEGLHELSLDPPVSAHDALHALRALYRRLRALS